jgi:hypothetical protein
MHTTPRNAKPPLWTDAELDAAVGESIDIHQGRASMPNLASDGCHRDAERCAGRSGRPLPPLAPADAEFRVGGRSIHRRRKCCATGSRWRHVTSIGRQ